MIGRNHLAIAIALAGANLLVFWQHGLVTAQAAAIFLLGVAIGSLLPDVDAGDARIFHGGPRWLRKLDFIFVAAGRITQIAVYLPLMVFGKGEHRGIMHSFSGAAVSSAFWAAAIWIAVGAFSLNSVLLLAAAGLFAGFVLHLACDSFTRSGVAWFAPFSGRRVCGQVATGKPSETLVAIGFLALAAVAYFITEKEFAILSQQPFALVPAVFAALVLAYFFTASGFLRVARLIPGFS